MLVVLGGLLGSGRRPLAEKLADKYGLYHYDIDGKKLWRPSPDKRGNFKVLQPSTDAERLTIYRTALREFPLLSKMYPNAVVDESFHREIPRKYFLLEARKYYSPVIFVWVDCDPQWAVKHIEDMHERGVTASVQNTLRWREKAQALLQEPAGSAPRFFSTVIDDAQVEDLWRLVQRSV
jgi:hypothetical protein